jgi:hypothetical protein
VGDRGGRLLNGEGGRFGLGAFVGCFVGLRWQLLAHSFLWFFGIFLCTRKRLGNA